MAKGKKNKVAHEAPQFLTNREKLHGKPKKAKKNPVPEQLEIPGIPHEKKSLISRLFGGDK